ncbi:MAG: Ig-like domain-containing protein [Deltaproteobacteria bacterium]|nr:Ig-like domain-containing protein [Deltaproteobacteria bacterium]
MSHFITALAVAFLGIAGGYFGNAAGHNEVPPEQESKSPDETVPTVIGTSPLNATRGVGINKNIAVTFSEAMNPRTLTTTTFRVTGPGLASISGTVQMDSTNHVAIFRPLAHLATNSFFMVIITAGAEDFAGNALASPHESTFVTTWMPRAMRL